MGNAQSCAGQDWGFWMFAGAEKSEGVDKSSSSRLTGFIWYRPINDDLSSCVEMGLILQTFALSVRQHLAHMDHILHLTLINAGSFVNRILKLNDFFTSHELDFVFLMKTWIYKSKSMLFTALICTWNLVDQSASAINFLFYFIFLFNLELSGMTALSKFGFIA